MNERIQSSATTALTAMVGATLLIGLTACANVDDLLHKQHRETYDTYAAAATDWVGVDIPAWIPADATDIRNLASLNEGVAVIRVVSDSPLAGTCETAVRNIYPLFDADWITDEWPDELQHCGEYEVMPTEDGWLGWFNGKDEGDVPDSATNGSATNG